MLTTDRRASIANAPGELARIRETYESGLYLQAYEQAKPWGPLETWEGTSALILAGRLAMNLGAPRLADRLHNRAWRNDRTNPEACYYRARTIFSKKGPLAAWRFLTRVGALDNAENWLRSDWLAMHAVVLGQFRDFDRAWRWMERAEEARPEWAWTQIERSQLLGMEDRYDEALAAAQYALTLHPWYRPAVQATAHRLQLLDRDNEAIAFLNEAAERLESGSLSAQLASLHFELSHYAEARRNYERFVELSPLLEEAGQKWLACRRSDCAYGCGDIASAISYARESGEPFFLGLADRLEANGDQERRVVLDVRFVRQHHQTCAPATLAAISRFWGISVDQEEVAEAICYDGTPDHRERAWAGENSWIAREFTVTWDVTVALIDRGVPFTLTTVDPSSAHLQAVIGYDARRRTILMRDPTEPYSGEGFADGLLERYRSSGPRGMTLVPLSRAELLEGIELPDSSLYDLYYQIQSALRDHDRDRAFASYELLRNQAPGHRLTLQGRRFIAIYDTDTTELLAAVEGLLALFPDDVNLRLSQLGCLGELARTEARLTILREMCADPKTDPLFRRQYAQELLSDAREHDTASRLVRQAMRARPVDASSLAILAELAWSRQDLEEALELHRFAASLDDKDEGFARSHFTAARYLRREEETMQMLSQRFRRFGTRSGQPARTLYWALSQLDRESEGLVILQEAVTLRPDDGDLQLFLAGAHGIHGEYELAKERLEAAKGKSRHVAWLRAAANLASHQGNLTEALRLWRQILEAEPAALDANQTVARLLAKTESRAAALDHLTRACDRFPHNVALHQAWIYRLRDEGPAEAEVAVRRLLAIHPADAWAHRELALVLGEQQRYEEALAEVEIARQLDPTSSTEASVRGQILENADRPADANEAYREAIRRSVDNEFAIARLIASCNSSLKRREALAFIEGELARQVIFGDGLIAFARQAKHTLESDELLVTLEKAWNARPDLWHAWAALIRHRLQRQELDEALDLANRAVARFPLLPVIWLDLAAVHEAKGDHEREAEALNRCLQINPGWGVAARQLATAFERNEDYQASRLVIERTIAHSPLDPMNHGFLADALWNLGERELAIERAKQAIRLDPEYDWAWGTLHRWSRELERPEVPADLARELTSLRGGDASCWMKLAENLKAASDLEERLEALQRVIALDPRRVSAHDLRAELLAEAGRFDEAESACRPSAWAQEPPVYLRGRAAWVEWLRGNAKAAIDRMQQVLNDESEYYWGWLKLAEWTCDTGTAKDYLDAAESLARVAPDDAVALAYLGEARLKSYDRKGAKAAFRRAHELRPDYSFAGMNLFDLELGDEAWNEAAQVLEVLKAQVGGEFVDAREVQWAAVRSDLPTALDALRRLCFAPLIEGDWPLRAADRAFRKAKWGPKAEAIYSVALDQPDVQPLVGMLWVEHRTERRRWGSAKRLPALLERGEVGRKALAAYVNAIGNHKSHRRLRACMRRYSQPLREDTMAWGCVGFALTSICRHEANIQWMSDWSERVEASPWMLINLVLSFRTSGQDDLARRVSHRALELVSDYSTPYHAIWLAFDEVLSGQTENSAERIRELNPGSFDETNQFLLHLTRLLIQRAQAAAAGEHKERITAGRAIARLGLGYSIPPEDYGAISKAFHRAIRQIAREEGGLRGFLWRLSLPYVSPRRRR